MVTFECTGCGQTHDLTVKNLLGERQTVPVEIKSMSGAEYPDEAVVSGCDECTKGVLFPPVSSDGEVIEFESEMDKSFTQLGVGVDALKKLQNKETA